MDLWGQAESKWEGVNFEPLPAGEYSVIIDDAKFDYTTGEVPKGHYRFSFTVLDGKYKGRKVQHKLWTEAANADYVKKCFSFIKNIYTLLQVPLPAAVPNSQDLFVLVNKPLNIKVRVKTEEYNNERREVNEILVVSSYRQIVAQQPVGNKTEDDSPFF